ncbi:hypothetical protein L6164_031032 [Bauhinia variegata]|uniref:Uncharacterized protein n=1 Tax=Bauhinia variegata TaxID=167791 RepID=A0ACB9LED4_BAUVA|nr:hypothetical protein L6164_031032 [Bauhinia variegata]
MDAAVSSALLPLASSRTKSIITEHYQKKKSRVSFPLRKSCNFFIGNEGSSTRLTAINDVSGILDQAPVEVTWQIVVGAIAGVTPFVVAGIEFSKRIIAQRRCKECGGSGLVLMEKEYFRCPECGGFLPWQSWKRFFSG